jgi:uncharacterized protein (TIGR02594 family)
MTGTPWLEIAKNNVGVAEIKGAVNNPRILEMYAKVGHDEIVDEEVAWCAAHVGSCLVDVGYAIPPKANNLMARSYLNYGTRLDAPKPGAIVVKARGKAPFGHVGIVEEVHDDGTFTVIAGNSSNKVKRETWKPGDPLKDGIRWPVEPGARPAPTKPVIKTAVKSKSVWAQLSAMVLVVTSYVTDWLYQAFDWIFGLVGSLPALTSDASGTVESAQQMAGWFNIEWSKVGMIAALGGMVVALVRHIQDKRRTEWD